MATNQEGYEQSGNPIGSLIGTAIGLAPIGFGAYRMANEIRSNAALNPAIPLGIGQSAGGNLSQVGRGIGEALAAASRDDRTADLQRLKKLTDDIMSDDGIQRMFQATSEQNALIQTLLETLDDPTSELSKDVLLSYREKLLDIARNQTSPDKMQETIQGLVNAINRQSPENTRLRMEKNFREYRKIGATLTPPSKQFDATSTFNPIETSSLSKAARKRYKHLIKNLGPGGAQRTELIGTNWGGRNQAYVRVYSGGAGKSSFLDVLPLDVGPGNSGVQAIFTNENLTTAYAAPRQFLDAAKVAGKKFAHLNEATAAGGIAIEDFFMNEFINRLVPSGPGGPTMPGYRDFRRWKTQFMTVMPRLGYSVTSPGANEHLNKALGSASNIAAVVNWGNITKAQQEETMLSLGTTAGFEAHAPGYQFLTRGIGDEPIGRIGLLAGSPIESLKSVGAATRGMFPVESRIEQVFGRESIFVSSRARTMGRGGHVGAGPRATKSGSVINHLGGNIEWADALTGATNKAVLLDVRGKVAKSLGGTGAAYTTGMEKVRSFTTKPILDPGEKGYMASKLFMDEIVANAKEGELLRLTREQIQKHGSFLGFGPQGAQHLRMDPRMTDMYVAYNITEAHGKRQINVMAMVERDMEVWKGFSMLHKGTVESMDPRAFRRMLKGMGMDRDMLRALRLRTRDVVATSGDMLKKGAGFLDLQMRSGYGLVAGAGNWESQLRDLATQSRFGLPETELGRTTGAVIQGLSTSKASAREAGMVLAGIYHNQSLLKGMNAPAAISQGLIEGAIKSAFGIRADEVIAAAQRGVALGATSMTQGMGPGDYSLGRGSVEPRFITNLQHRLKNMGMTTDQAAQLLGGIYRQKLGFSAGIKSAGGLLRLTESLTGTAGLMEGIAREGMKTFTLKDLAKLGGKDFEKIVAANPDGFLLDLATGADTVATRAIASNALDLFGQGQLFIPGRDVADAMKDTFIKTSRDLSGNASDILIHGEYTRNVKDFFEGLASAGSRSLGSPEYSRAVMETFKRQMVDLTSRSVMGLARGKIKGMQSMYARPYDLDTDVGWHRGVERRMARAHMKRTGGMAAFMDATGFMSQLNDFMGNTNSPERIRDAAKKAEMFFLSGEEALRTGDFGKAKGVYQIATRHPELGLGNVTPLQMFRHVKEVGVTGDIDRAIFNAVNANNKFGEIKSWRDVAALPSTDRFTFFHEFVGQMGSLAPTGGGSIFLPRQISEVMVGGMKDRKQMVDFGVSGAAIGDFDGDQWMSMMLNQESGRAIESTLQSSTSDEWLKADAIYKIKGHIFAEEAKDALEKHNRDKGVEFFDSAERVRESLLKEQAAKSAVGSLDTRLNKMRMSLLDLRMGGKAERASIDQALALLKIVQEHAVIKGKKLPVYLPFAEMLTGAIDQAFETGDMSAFNRVMKEEIFPGSKLFGEGLIVESVSSPYEWARSITNEKLSLQPTMELIGQAVQTARVTGVADMPTTNWLTRYLGKGTPEEVSKYMALLQAGETLESSILSGASPVTGKQIAAGVETTFRRIGSSLAAIDSKLLGLGAAAVAGSLAVAGAIGAQGYSPKPMVAEGEVVDPAVRQAIAGGDVFGGPSPQDLGRRMDQYGMMNRPFTTPTTYLQAPNSYQVRGNIPDIRGMGMVNDYLGSMGSGVRGGITVRDQRMPITQNYMDRMTGEY